MRVLKSSSPKILVIFGLLFFSILVFTHAIAQPVELAFESALPQLLEKSFRKKTKAAKAVAATGDPRAAGLLEAMLNGKLFYIKKSTTLVYASKDPQGYIATDVISGSLIGNLPKNRLRKVSVNNKLRKTIRLLLAESGLANPDPIIRHRSVMQMLDRMTPELVVRLKQLERIENNQRVRSVMQVAIDLDSIKNRSDTESINGSLQRLSGRLEPQVRNAIALLANDSAMKNAKPRVVAAANRALENIDKRTRWYKKIETAFFGISLGSVLVLAAIGLAITFGVMGVINMAHGELIMIGAYTTYTLQTLLPGSIGSALLLSIPLAFVVSGLVGMLIERSIISHLYGRPLETLLATFGVSLVLQQAVRSIYSPLNRSVESPAWLSGTLEINSALSLTYNRLYIIGFCLIIFMALYLVMKKSSLGLQVRAISQNREMARAMGIKASRVDMLTFGLGSGIAGMAGVALSQLTNVGPNLGQGYIIDSFLVVVFGGVGNLWGTLVSGFSLGIANKFMEPWSGAVLAKILVLVFIIVFIQKFPSGLFPQRGRAAES